MVVQEKALCNRVHCENMWMQTFSWHWMFSNTMKENVASPHGKFTNLTLRCWRWILMGMFNGGFVMSKIPQQHRIVQRLHRAPWMSMDPWNRDRCLMSSWEEKLMSEYFGWLMQVGCNVCHWVCVDRRDQRHVICFVILQSINVAIEWEIMCWFVHWSDWELVCWMSWHAPVNIIFQCAWRSARTKLLVG